MKYKDCKDCKFNMNGSCDPEENWIDCCLLGNHPYSEIECPECEHIYCWNCAGFNGESPYAGGSYTTCPKCDKIIYDSPWKCERVAA